jgi:hypothetical protein
MVHPARNSWTSVSTARKYNSRPAVGKENLPAAMRPWLSRRAVVVVRFR